MIYPEKIGDEIIMENVEMKKALEEWRKIDQSKGERKVAWRRLIPIEQIVEATELTKEETNNLK